jgi:hypothetical protein
MRHARLIPLGFAAACLILPSIDVLAQRDGSPAAVGLPGATGAPAKSMPGPKELPSSDPRDFNGFWKSVFLPTKGPPSASPFALSGVPTLPETQAEIDKIAELIKAGHPVATISTSCRAVGAESTLFNLFVTAVVQTPNDLYVMFEEPLQIRKIRLNGTHSKHVELTYRGDSVGHWEGNALVVDTIGFNGIGELDEAGLPVGKQLHTVERITKSADGKTLDFEITLADPEHYSQPFTVHRRWVWADDEQQTENDCAESPRSDSEEVTVYLNPLYRPTCTRVEGKGMAPSHVVCRMPGHTN